MMDSKHGGGKTAPRLIQDLSLYNPQRPTPGSHNVLTESLQYDGISPPKTAWKKNICRHRWATKENQTSLPVANASPDPASIYVAAACCLECRCHVQLSLDFRSEGLGVSPCPSDAVPLHHFLYTPNSSCGFRQHDGEHESGSWTDTQQFQCSSPSCSARLSVQLRSPRLTPEWVALLSDKSQIDQRARNAMSDDPERFEGHAIPPPTQVLSNLRAYISNAMTKPESRRILGNNKKWLLSLGDPCADLLEYLGFKRVDCDWIPPCPDVSAAIPFENPLNILLDDVEKEIDFLLNQQPTEEKRLLGSTDYKKDPASRTVDLGVDDEHPFYAGLGSVRDFHDELLNFAYDRQVETDFVNAPYYLECLQGIARGRKSEDLQTKAAIEASSGKVSRSDIKAAYDEFGLDFRGPFLDDDTIIGNFQSRIADAPRQEADLRRALSIIGTDRGSSRIQHIASNTVTTYEQALTWLGATEDMDEGFLFSMYGLKVGENSSNEEMARKCIALIAERRQSKALKMWMETGKLGDVEMDFGQAYARLGINNRTVDDDSVLAAYQVLMVDTPSQAKELGKALAAIAKSRGSQNLLKHLDQGTEGPDQPLSEWPVGLNNIGNTCYLNSLLQFYFTVKPLRDLVLNFEDFRMDIEDHAYDKKQVGSRKVSRKEVERAQKFVYELRKLFRSMISAPRREVKPEQELARLTLMSSSIEESWRRKSTLTGTRPSLGEINGQPLQGPLLPAEQVVVQLDMSVPEKPMSNTAISDNAKTEQTTEVSSEGTLVETPGLRTTVHTDYVVLDSKRKQEQDLLDDKENLAPTKGEGDHLATVEHKLSPLAESSASRTNEQLDPRGPTKLSDQNQDSSTSATIESGTIPAAPNRPPPVPPREKRDNEKEALLAGAEYGAQQDVTEVIANVLFQLQCAIKPESIDESGEQIDQIKRLFFGKLKSYITNKQNQIRTKEEFISDIKVDVASGSRDIYSALDGAFDVQEVEVDGALEPQYATISQLPPILQIHVQRAQYNAQTHTAFKSENHLGLQDTIYMDRYMDSSDPDLIQRRQACWEWKKELARLEARRTYLSQTELGIDMPEVLRSTVAYLKQCSTADPDDPIEIDASLLNSLEKAADDAKQELLGLEERIKFLASSITSQFTDLRALPYSLHSVFIHRGMVNSGHYWIYIRDFKRGIWRKYNDEYVHLAKEEDIYHTQPTNRPATPYFLVYIRDDRKDELVDAVYRDVEEIPHASQQDIMMSEDYTDYTSAQPLIPVVKNPAEKDVTQPSGSWNAESQQLHPDVW